MTRPGPWSGLAPAVDAHLHRWRQSDRAKPIAVKALHALESSDEKVARAALAGVLRNDIARQWFSFGASYGIPDENGNPTATAFAVTGEGPLVPGLVEGATIVGREQFQADEVFIQQGMALMLREAVMLARATTHYVSAEVIQEVTDAAALILPEPLHRTDLFDLHGFAVLEEAVPFADYDPHSPTLAGDLDVWVRAVGWDIHGGIYSNVTEDVGDGVTLFVYSTVKDQLDGYWAQFLETRAPDEQDRQRIADLESLPPDVLVILDVIPWRFGSEWAERDDIAYVPGTVPSTVGAMRRWFLSLMRLCWQTIIVPQREHVQRQARRRFEHMAERKPLLDYTVLRLRRVADPVHHETGTGRPLDHRVVVRAHWRNVHVKSLGPARLPDGRQDPATHRLVWVERHWRGPEDGPIGAMEAATVVVR